MVCLVAVLVGCGDEAGAERPDGLRVVATTSVIADIAGAIGGDDIVLTTLVGPDRDSRQHQPTAADRRAVAAADLIVEHGRGMEPFLDDLIADSRSAAARIALTAGIALADVPITVPGAGAPGPERSDDARVWQSPWAGRRMARAVRAALSEADPAHAAGYATRAEAYDEELRQVDAEIAALAAEIPPARRVLVTAQNTFAYFARQYGFATITAGATTSASGQRDESAPDGAAFLAAARASGARAAFGDNVRGDERVRRVAQEGRITLGPELYGDAHGGPRSPAPDYSSLLRHNASAIHRALSEE